MTALKSLESFREIPSQSKLHKSLRVQDALLIYAAMNDDDDEVRDLACEASVGFANLKDNLSRRLVPLAASKAVAAQLVINFYDSKLLCTKAIEKMTSCRFHDNGIKPTALERFRSASELDSALFLVEKQNLFIDDSREAFVWSKVLKNLGNKAITAERSGQLATWTLEGLNVLKETAASRDDGPLGWTSKPEMFRFGSQVICAVDVLLEWRLKTRKSPVAGHTLRRALWELINVGVQKQLHPLWIQMAERVLKESVIKRLAAVGRALQTLEKV